MKVEDLCLLLMKYKILKDIYVEDWQTWLWDGDTKMAK